MPYKSHSYTRTIDSITSQTYSYCNTCFTDTGFEYHRDYLNILIYPDKYTQKIDLALNSYSNILVNADKKANIDVINYANHIDSLTIFTLFDLDDEHPAKSKINDILQQVSYDNSIKTIPLDSIEYSHDSNYNLKLISSASESDSVQFRVTGKLSNGILFDTTTQLIIF